MKIGLKQKLNYLDKSSYVLPRCTLETESIDIVTETKYHSLIIDDNLKWNYQIKSVQNEMSKAFGLLKYAKKYLPLSTLKDLYEFIVEPNVSYCCSFEITVDLLS